MTKKPHINCDLGEGIENETAMMPYINACSIACGGHYGNKTTIIKTLNLAINNKVSVGAHPSYPDLENFGRQSIKMNKKAFIKSIQDQLQLFHESYCSLIKHGITPHIKAHGALYNDLCANASLVSWYLEAIKIIPFKELFTPENGILYTEAIKQGIQIKKEAFIDRRYNSEGFLASRNVKGSVIGQDSEALLQLTNHLKTGHFTSLNGLEIKLDADTYCLHGDHPNSLKRLQLIHENCS